MILNAKSLIRTLKNRCLNQCLLQYHECALPFFVDDEVSVLTKKGGEWLEDFCNVLYESSVESDVLEKAPQILYGFG